MRLGVVVCWSVAAGLGGCSIDHRRLQLGMGASAGHSDDGSPQGGESVSNQGGRDSGDAGAGGVEDLVDGCADLDTDGVADCRITLLENATFGDDVGSWAPMAAATWGWDEKNALADLPSGSGRLKARASRVSASQCVPLVGEKLVIGYAHAFVEPGQSADQVARALLEVSFFEQDECSGERDRFFETPPSARNSEWVTVQAGSLSKPTTRSVSLALVGTQGLGMGELTAYFDNVLLKAIESPAP